MGHITWILQLVLCYLLRGVKMTIIELIEKLGNLVFNQNAGESPIGIQLHNTIHDIEEVVAGPGVFYLRRVNKPSHVLDHKHEWIKIKTAREMAKQLGIKIDEEAGQERIDFETGKRQSDE